MKRIAVLMTCYNRVDTTLECLRRLFAQEVPEGYSFDVGLVDDASPDKTGEKVKVAYPQTNVVQGTGKLFWCKGMRLAWDKAAEAHDYDFYLWLNDDTMLCDDALVTILKDWEWIGQRDQGVVCAPFVNGPGSRQICYSGFSGDEIANLEGRLEFNRPIKVEGEICGNMLLVPKVVYKSVGPICSLYHHGSGDYDYGRQVRKKGFSCYSASKVLGWCTANHGLCPDLSKVPFAKRISLLWNPKGINLHDTMVFRYRNDGIVRCVLSVGHVVMRALLGIK